jgi:hypothetical protein
LYEEKFGILSKTGREEGGGEGMRAGDDDCISCIGRKRFDVNVFVRSMSSNKKQNSTRRERE